MPIKINNQLLPNFRFPGGECSVNVSEIEIGKKTIIRADLHSSDDLICLLLTVNAIRTKNLDTVIDLEIPYFPYARQDRVCNPGEAFSLSVVADLINGLNCASVTLYDPHSDVTPRLIQRCHVVSQAQILAGSAVEDLIKCEKLTLLASDKGAAKKTESYANILTEQGVQVEALYCTKIRDQKTGRIIKTDLPNLSNAKGLIILDDICDGGATFLEIAHQVRKVHSGKLYLYVTHGIFSKGLAALGELFEHLYCYHTFLNASEMDTNKLTLIGE